MKKSNILKLAITAVALLLIPKRSSPQADNLSPNRTATKDKNTHEN